jgi:hypothetical protein
MEGEAWSSDDLHSERVGLSRAGVASSLTPGGSGSSTVSAPSSSFRVASGGRGTNATSIAAPPCVLPTLKGL